MTIEEFDNTKWGYNMFVTYINEEQICASPYLVLSVNFAERLIQIADDTWVRCENVQLA